MLNIVMLNVIMLNVVMLNVVWLNVDMLNVNMLNVIMQNVIMLNVMGQYSSRCVSGGCRVNFNQKCCRLFVIRQTGVWLNVVASFFRHLFLIYNGESQKADAVTFLSHPKDFFC